MSYDLYDPSDVRKILTEAAFEIDLHGLAKGEYEDIETGRLCAYGALNRVISDDNDANEDGWLDPDLTYLLNRAIAKVTGFTRPLELSLWNDDPTTTAGNVSTMFRLAATAVVAVK